jgi:hypothetical protein
MTAQSSLGSFRRLSIATASIFSLSLSAVAPADIVDEAKAQGKTPAYLKEKD